MGVRKIKIDWHSKKLCDILIYDNEGASLIEKCLPAKVDSYVLRVRSGIPLIWSAFFFWILVGKIIRYINLKKALLATFVKFVKPKIIITFVDNSAAICKFPGIAPGVSVLAVQNGTRWDLASPEQPHMEFDHYFSFGLMERDIFLQGGHRVKHFHPIGSIRAGFSMTNQPVSVSKKYDICFISQFAPIISNSTSRWSDKVDKAYYEAGKRLFNLAARFANEKKLNLCVAMRSSSQSETFQEELEYYSCDEELNIEYIPQYNYSSYEATQSSRLSVTISSTLGYEAMGLGERVLFAKDIAEVASVLSDGVWRDNFCTINLPEYQRLYSYDYSHFSLKANALIGMSNEEYYEYSKGARSYYMNMREATQPHNAVREVVESLLLKNVVANRPLI
jgi:surface carbohydrate biosynthesis protein